MGLYSDYDIKFTHIRNALKKFYEKYGLSFDNPFKKDNKKNEPYDPIDYRLQNMIKNIKNDMGFIDVPHIGPSSDDEVKNEKDPIKKGYINAQNLLYYKLVNDNINSIFVDCFELIANQIKEKRVIDNTLFKDTKNNLFKDYCSLMSDIYSICYFNKLNKVCMEDVLKTKEQYGDKDAKTKKVFFFKPDENTFDKFKKYFDLAAQVENQIKSDGKYNANYLVESSNNSINELENDLMYDNVIKPTDASVQNVLADYKILKNHYNKRNGFIQIFWSFGTKKALKKMENQIKTLVEQGILTEKRNEKGKLDYDDIVEATIEPSKDFKGVIDYSTLDDMKYTDEFANYINESIVVNNENIRMKNNSIRKEIVNSMANSLYNGLFNYSVIDKDNYEIYKEAVEKNNDNVEKVKNNIIGNKLKELIEKLRNDTRNKRKELRDIEVNKQVSKEEKDKIYKKISEDYNNEFTNIANAKSIQEGIDLANNLAKKYGVNKTYETFNNQEFQTKIDNAQAKKVTAKSLEDVEKIKKMMIDDVNKRNDDVDHKELIDLSNEFDESHELADQFESKNNIYQLANNEKNQVYNEKNIDNLLNLNQL